VNEQAGPGRDAQAALCSRRKDKDKKMAGCGDRAEKVHLCKRQSTAVAALNVCHQSVDVNHNCRLGLPCLHSQVSEGLVKVGGLEREPCSTSKRHECLGRALIPARMFHKKMDV
jgi:hypothetical protein